MKNIFLPITHFVLITCSVGLHAQSDSIAIKIDRLKWEDIAKTTQKDLGTTVISGSRSEQKLSDLPFTIYVIEAEEIRNEGYITLIDVLESVPGIRTSEVGSGLDGGLFMMRGLVGNSYAKILINDVPVRPFVTGGMPIGGQLPIPQAERIEIIFGPAATLYGADASAGVVNIIVRDSERPTFAHANISVGELGFLHLNTMFGGKFGRGKEVVKFNGYGNYLAQNDRKIVYDRERLYNTLNYAERFLGDSTYYIDKENYRGTVMEPSINDLPHQSFAIGTNIKYRNFILNANIMYRRDHSAIGLSPLAVSYANPLNFTAERIQSYSMTYSKQWNQLSMKLRGSALFYRTDIKNSVTYVKPILSLAIDNLLLSASPPEFIDSLSSLADVFYFSNTRFSGARSAEYSFESTFSYQFSEHLSSAAGINISHGNGNALVQYQVNPVQDFSPDQRLPFLNLDEVRQTEVSGFAELYYNSNRINAIVGVQVLNREDNYIVDGDPIVNPRIALQYKLSERWSIRMSYAKAFRFSSPYFQNTSALLSTEFQAVQFGNEFLEPEITYALEIGSRFVHNKDFNIDLSIFFNRSDLLFNYQLELQDLEVIKLGYFNDDASRTELLGSMFNIHTKNEIATIEIESDFSAAFFVGTERLNRFAFSDTTSSVAKLEGLRGQPNILLKWKLNLWPDSKINVIFNHLYSARSLTRNSILYQTANGSQNLESLYNDGYYILGAVFGLNINKHLRLKFVVDNIFNKEYAGIDASLEPDGLIYNPQPKRMFRVGLNYQLSGD